MASDIHLRRLSDFQDNTSLSSMELSLSPARAPEPFPSATIISNTDAINGFPPTEHPLSPPSHHGNCPTNLLRVPTLIVTTTNNSRRNAPRHTDGISSPFPKGEVTEDDNEEGRPRSILSILSRSLSSLSFGSAHSHPRQSAPALDTDGQSSHFSFSSSNGLRNVFRGLVRRSKRTQESPSGSLEGEDSISDTSGEELINPVGSSMTSTAIKKRLDSLAGSTYRLNTDSARENVDQKRRKNLRRWINNVKCGVLWKQFLKYRIDQHGTRYFIWLWTIVLAVIYNAMAIPLRASFRETVTGDGVIYVWLAFDILCDLIYLMDAMLVQPRLCNEGCSGLNLKSPAAKRQLFLKHIRSFTFWADILCLLPLDILYTIPALRFNVLLRIPRLLKVHRIRVFQDRFESRTKFPNVFRVTKLVLYFLYIIHVYTCIYYSVSEREGFGVNGWVYDGNGTGYLRCFYWAIQTIATTHNLDRGDPVTNLEYKIDLLGYLFSVFVLAVIFGEIRNIVEASNGPKTAAYKRWDRIRKYMSDWKLSNELQRRVKAWYDYALTQQLNLDEAKVFESLPTKMKADLAIHVHLDTLSKVSLFKDCEKSLLRELVLRLQPVLFVPNDFICKKGEIGKEMYIVNKGLVQVIGGPTQNSRVLAELGPGSVFGEISLLAVGGGNRRTAHVVSKGFSSIFVLSKRDLNETLEEYPDAREMLRNKARLILRQDKKREKKESKTEGSLAENARLASKIKNNQAAKVAFMAFTTAPAKAARAQAAAAAAAHAATKMSQEGEEEEMESSLSEINSSSTQSTIVEVHEEEDPTNKKTSLSQQRAGTTATFNFKPKPAKMTRGLSYTSLWPSARDVVISAAAQPNTCDNNN